METDSPRIEWSQKSDKQCLRFTFGQALSEKGARVAIAEWRKAFQSKPDESITLIWDCKKMKSYESAARAVWTDALKEMKPRIEAIWLISDSALIRMGASVMGMVSSLKIKAISAESEIEV